MKRKGQKVSEKTRARGRARALGCVEDVYVLLRARFLQILLHALFSLSYSLSLSFYRCYKYNFFKLFLVTSVEHVGHGPEFGADFVELLANTALKHL